MATISVLRVVPEFPKTAWLALAAGTRKMCIQQWHLRAGELEDFEPLVRNQRVIGDPLTAEEWRQSLRKEGVVVFDLGLPPRDARLRWVHQFGLQTQPTRAELLARFAAWLDANPEWWDGLGDGRKVTRTGGKEQPREGLRALAWAKVLAACGSDKAACAFLERVFSCDSGLKAWFSLSLEPRAATSRSRLGNATVQKWQRRICEPG